MADEEQVIRSDTNNSGGVFSYEELEQIAFWLERTTTILVVFNWVPSDVWIFLTFAYTNFIISNFFYIYLHLQVIRTQPPRRRGGGELIKHEDFAFLLERLAIFFVFVRWVPSHELCRMLFRTLPVPVFIFSNIVYFLVFLQHVNAMYYASREKISQKKGTVIHRESKVQAKAKDERNEINEENTGKEKAKLHVSLKESTVEEKARDEMKNAYEESEEESEEFDDWEEERSQLMYELGAARASLEIYRQLLHDLHYHQP